MQQPIRLQRRTISGTLALYFLAGVMRMEAKVTGNMTIESIESLDFFLGDRLARFLITRKWTPLRVALVAYVFAILSSFTISLIAGTLFPNPKFRALLVDRFYFVSETLILPILWGYYVWICNAPRQVLIRLQDTKILSPRKEDLRAVSKILDNHLLPKLGIFCGALAAGAYFYQYSDYSPPLWYNSTLLFLACRTILVIMPTAFAACSLFGRGIINTIIFKRILKDVTVNPLHPDKAGGLLPLGQYALKSTHIIVLAGVVVALAEYAAFTTGTLATAYSFHLAFAVYIVAAPLSFFAPLGAARNAMLTAKNDLLLEISKQFNQDFALAYKDLDGSGESLKVDIEKIEQLQKLQKLTASFPVWPFDIGTVRRFVLAVLSPILTIAFSILSEILKNYLLP